MSPGRQFFPMTGARADANVQPRHPADAAAWIWHPACAVGETALLKFTLEFATTADETVRFHVTADQRFQLTIDGAEIGFGPDRGDVEKWPVATYAVFLPAGKHRVEALVWWLHDEALAGGPAPVRPPVAQATWRGGFLLAGDDAMSARLNTGRADWFVQNLTLAVRLVRPECYAYHDIGPEFHFDAAKWRACAAGVTAAVVAVAIPGNPHGVQRPGWRLESATLPEQARVPVRSVRVRALTPTWSDGPFETLRVRSEEAEAWTALFAGTQALTVPANTERTVLCDFEDYVCGYAAVGLEGGAGARVRIDWAEALHAGATRAAVTKETPKGHRDVIGGKIFFGFGDEFFPNGNSISIPAWWWRAGRYLRVQVRTASEPLTLAKLTITSTGYPLGDAAQFHSDDQELNALMRLCEKTTRVCAHEVWADCPYYEQMAYVGDSRLAALNNYAVFADDRLSRRMLELFDDSRCLNGLVAERAPSLWPQVSVTYSLLWVLMVRDFAWWRDDREWVRTRLRGVRAMLDEIGALADAEGLLRRVPGWSFVDWVPAWSEGCGPGVRAGDSSIVNLHWLLALRAHAELENAFGEPELAALATRRAHALEAAILHRFWNRARGLLADTSDQVEFSEHAQALGVLAGMRTPDGLARWMEAWIGATDLARATIYFSFYVMDAFRRAGRERELHARVQLWRDVLPTGLRTLPEAPEPTRSDCHGWSAHLRWHMAASVAGVRPSTPAFARVEVAPLPGDLAKIETTVRHPRGLVTVSLAREGRRLRGIVELPEGVEGEFRWNQKSRALCAGKNQIDET